MALIRPTTPVVGQRRPFAAAEIGWLVGAGNRNGRLGLRAWARLVLRTDAGGCGPHAGEVHIRVATCKLWQGRMLVPVRRIVMVLRPSGGADRSAYFLLSLYSWRARIASWVGLEPRPMMIPVRATVRRGIDSGE